jgi:16S rRNA processing protein RimM
MPSLPENPSYVVTGRVIKPYGVLGWVKIEPLSTNPRRFQAGNAFILQGDEEGDRLLLEEARDIPGAVLAKFRGLESREEAERLKGLELMIRPEEAGEAPPGSLWEHQILGMEVRTDAGRYLGRVAEVMETGANDVPGGQGRRRMSHPHDRGRGNRDRPGERKYSDKAHTRPVGGIGLCA